MKIRTPSLSNYALTASLLLRLHYSYTTNWANVETQTDYVSLCYKSQERYLKVEFFSGHSTATYSNTKEYCARYLPV